MPKSLRTVALAALLAALIACGGRRPAQLPPAQTFREVSPRIGVALGGGGARGFAEVGVLRVLEQEKIPVSAVAGTSVGSLIGALYADSGNALDLEFAAVAARQEDLFDYAVLSLLDGGLVKGVKLEAFLEAHLKHKTLETLAIPFAAVAVDLRTGEQVVFERGSVARAVHASAAIPGVFVPVEIGGRTFVDGGVLNPVPADVVRRMGADVVIAVSVPPPVPTTAPKSPVDVALHAVTLMTAEIGRLRAREADVVIEPEVGPVRYDDFTQKRRLLEAGAAAARNALPAIRAAIAAKTRRVPVS